MKKICVFCGSSQGSDPVFGEAAKILGKHLADNNIGLVFGGGRVGLMGIIANTVMEYGGHTTGIIPQKIMDMEIAHNGLTKLHVVETMHERKALMAQLSDGFITLPGGFGTLDELSEVLTYNQLRYYDKPVGILNVNSYFDGLLQFLDHCMDQGFVRPEHRNNIHIADNAPELIEKMLAYQPVAVDKWIDDIRSESASGS
ncbi:MAG: TIGR00730 family Rossman fold protein [Bacteroidales bacterium]|nr:TIGR00730 family Rossman fold protein [Bacteroidales bacterium]